MRSVLLYGAETWRTSNRIESRLRGFEGRCLRRILNIWWEHRVTNKEVAERTGIECIVDEVKKRRWRWLGHVMRMHKSRHPLAALTWTPQGKRTKGRPQGTWRRTVDEERTKAGKTWNELRWLAQDRVGWRAFVGALCSSRGDGWYMAIVLCFVILYYVRSLQTLAKSLFCTLWFKFGLNDALLQHIPLIEGKRANSQTLAAVCGN